MNSFLTDWEARDSVRIPGIDVLLTERIPAGVRTLCELFADRLRHGELDIFAQRLTAQDGSLIADGVNSLGSMDILKMTRLSEAVEGCIPGFDALLPMAKPLVRALGIYRDQLPPEAPE